MSAIVKKCRDSATEVTLSVLYQMHARDPACYQELERAFCLLDSWSAAQSVRTRTESEGTAAA
ncbi:hypothetical protein A2U01_0085687, partial [Trifolium medium]|nr:hypothetical protein [Trifolium medium]